MCLFDICSTDIHPSNRYITSRCIYSQAANVMRIYKCYTIHTCILSVLDNNTFLVSRNVNKRQPWTSPPESMSNKISFQCTVTAQICDSWRGYTSTTETILRQASHLKLSLTCLLGKQSFYLHDHTNMAYKVLVHQACTLRQRMRKVSKTK